MFNDPGQLNVSDDGELYITYSDNHRIQILDKSLRFKHSITHESMKYHQDLKLTTESLQDNSCIHVFSCAGDKLRSFFTRGIGMQITGFFFLGAEKNLIISDCEDQPHSVLS